MALVTWRIAKGLTSPVEKSLEQWGFENAKLVMRNQDVDEMTIEDPDG